MRRKRAAEKAAFCLGVGISPSDYDGLTLLERQMFIKEHNKRAKKKG